MIATGRVFQLLTLLFVSGSIFYFISRAQKGRVPRLRSIAGLTAIREAVGRATEMGGTVMIIPGIGGLTTVEAPETVAGVSVIGYVSSLAARYGTKVVSLIRMPEVVPLAEETMKAAFQKEGKLESYNPEMVRFVSGDQWGVATAAMGIMHREKVAANIMIGFFAGEALALAEAAAGIGAIQIAGTATNTTQLPWFATICDYVLFGEEVYAAGAVLSENPQQIGSLVGQDPPKMVAFGLILLGIVLHLLGIDWLARLMKW